MQWGSPLGRWITGWMLVALVGLLTSCGAGVPDTVVEQALTYQLSGVDSPRYQLVGQDRLGSRLMVFDVNVNTGRPLKLPQSGGNAVSAKAVSAKVVEGTYTVGIQPLGGGRSYRRTEQPFKITLLSDQKDPPTWQLLTPVAGSRSTDVSDLAQAQWVDFMPTPIPTPAPTPTPAATPTPAPPIMADEDPLPDLVEDVPLEAESLSSMDAPLPEAELGDRAPESAA